MKGSVLTNDVISNFELGYIHQYKQEVDSLDFTKDGAFLMTGSMDNSVRIFSVKSGKCVAELMCRKFGLGLVRTTHSNHYVLHSSRTENDNHIRYLGLKQVEYLRYFEGHKEPVLSLAMSPQSDQFVSSSRDRTIRIWDLREKDCKGAITNTYPNPLVALGPKGDVLAVACQINVVRFFNMKQLGGGPFRSILLDESPLDFRCIKYSPDGKYLVLVSSDSIIMLDSFDGRVMWKKEFDLEFVKNVDFTPTSKQVVVGTSKDAEIFFLEVESGNQVHKIGRTAHIKFISSVVFNPRYSQLVTASTEVNFWIPRPSKRRKFQRR